MMKSLGMVLIGAAAIAFLVPPFCDVGREPAPRSRRQMFRRVAATATAFVWSDRVGMMVSSATLRQVSSHPISCIVEKTGAVLHCIKCTRNSSNGGPP